jgi:hypothetical protein
MEEDVDLPFGLLGTQAISVTSGYDAGFRRLLQDLLATEKHRRPRHRISSSLSHRAAADRCWLTADPFAISVCLRCQTFVTSFVTTRPRRADDRHNIVMVAVRS